ncbi:MAG: hypothetical protein LBH25_00580 [Fibromonadaceae bacterium]|jgi:type I restriction enzyme R subunit|nr:hypothetical protein [Fibromonadaceae bacterium]
MTNPSFVKIKDTFLLINEGFNLQRDELGKSAIHINYIDFGEPKNNI